MDIESTWHKNKYKRKKYLELDVLGKHQKTVWDFIEN